MVYELQFHVKDWSVSQAIATAKSQLQNYSFTTYEMGVRAEENEKKSLLAQVRKEFSKEFSQKQVLQFPDIGILMDFISQKVILRIFPLIITGHYQKLQRGIAQTRHFCYQCKGVGRFQGKVCDICNGEKILTKESVQELITPFFLHAFEAKEMLFHGAGREDVDVLMLGNGRPFALSIENPKKRDVDVHALEEKINAQLKFKVHLLHLRIGQPSDVETITQSYHAKRYRAVAECSSAADFELLAKHLGKKTDVIQFTPTRMEKRRALKERMHWIVLENYKKINKTQVEITLHASQGCYIKEFISGDEGKSVPSLSEWLGEKCMCKELDVIEIVENFNN